MSREGGSFFIYLALLIGMGLVGAYFWYVFITPTTMVLFQYIMIVSGALLVASSFGFAFTKTRSSRVMLTAGSGMFGGVHFLLVVSIFEPLWGVVLFAWVAFGILIAFAGFVWLYE